MGYLHIDNLYKNRTIIDPLINDEVYCMEKIHGTSAHLKWTGSTIEYFSGGEKLEAFKSIFNHEALTKAFVRLSGYNVCTVFGEAYGGKCQKMSETYGPKLKFVAFDFQTTRYTYSYPTGDTGNYSVWQDVPTAQKACMDLGLEFVHFVRLTTFNPADIDAERDRDSVQAVRNGMGPGKLREGIVIRPVIERTYKNGERMIAKHKRPEFSESNRNHLAEVDPSKAASTAFGQNVAMTHVTPMRMEHVVDHLLASREDKDITFADIPALIRMMQEDVVRECEEETWKAHEKSIDKAIGGRTVQLIKERIYGKNT